MDMNQNGLAEAIKTIASMAQKGTTIERVLGDDGVTYILSSDSDGKPNYCPLPFVKKYVLDTMQLNTLSAFVNFIKSERSFGRKEPLYVNVINSDRVIAYTTTPNDKGVRVAVAEVNKCKNYPFSFGCGYDFEKFVVELRSKFIPTEDLKSLLCCLKTVTQSNEVSTEDNGITQVVTAKNGAKLGSVSVQPVWMLKPYRTFTEIEQPESLFLLRLSSDNDRTNYTLYETDGGAWVVESIARIKAYLTESLKDDHSTVVL